MVHAPNRNPAEPSFAFVDKRLSRAQLKEFSQLIKFYSVRMYYIDDDGTMAVIHSDGMTMGYLKKSGHFIPEEGW